MAVLKSLFVALCVCAVIVAAADADVEMEDARPRRSRSGKKLVTPRVLPSKAMMDQKHIVIVPKGDPRARPATQQQSVVPVNPFSPTTRVLKSTTPVLKSTAGAGCSAIGGSCILRSACASPSTVQTGLCPGSTYCCVPPTTTPQCAAKKGRCILRSSCASPSTVQTGLCPGSTYCCVPPSTGTNSPQCAARKGQCMARSACTTGNIITGLCPGSTYCCGPAPDATSCPVYFSVPAVFKGGNGGESFGVVPINAQHFVYPERLSWPDHLSDNTILKSPTGCAFARMWNAASQAGVYLKISSGFRSYARQKYFWDCYQTQQCNGGNLAAYPGRSNHGLGMALDLNTDCGRQDGSPRPPWDCKSSKVYMWLLNNAQKFGFIRTVQSEPWHWEFSSGSNPWWAFF